MAEKFYLEDGRVGEKHLSIGESGEKIVDIFVEPKTPLMHEKRVIEKHKEVLAERIVETIKDGEVVDKQVFSMEPDVRLQLREHIGLSERQDINAQNYISRAELPVLIAQALSINSDIRAQSVKAQSVIVTKQEQAEMALGAKVAADQKMSMKTVVIWGAVIIGQIIILGAIYLYA